MTHEQMSESLETKDGRILLAKKMAEIIRKNIELVSY